jgi:hypothetical protein
LALLLVSPAGAAGVPARAAASMEEVIPRVFLLDARHLAATRNHLRSGETSLAPALAALERGAKTALKSGPFSVMHKDQIPPSGDKHDYMSLAPYFWPDPSKSNGLRTSGATASAIRPAGRRIGGTWAA